MGLVVDGPNSRLRNKKLVLAITGERKGCSDKALKLLKSERVIGQQNADIGSVG